MTADTNRVLVVDDELTIRVALRRCFSRMGWAVDEASNGESAWALIALDEEQPPPSRYRMVVCDLRMPGLNGIDLYERVRARYPAVLPRMVISTGDIVSQEAADFVTRSGCEVLQKPFELSTIRELAVRLAASQAT
ncbi:MAG: response regulator [Gemmatimonadetes bacterium]|nr:response regulator [Gemmatimonadota bacterium]